MFYVDIPQEECVENPEHEWLNVGVFDTKAEAIAWAKQTFGADDEGKIQLVSFTSDED